MSRTTGSDIQSEILRVSDILILSEVGIQPVLRTSRRGVPYIVINDKISACFFWNTKVWKVWKWDSQNTFIGRYSPDDISTFIINYLKSENKETNSDY